MGPVVSDPAGARRHRRRLTNRLKESLRELGTQLSQLNHHVGAKVNLKSADFDCLDLIGRHGPLSPSTLARLAGVHPATLTGIVDRLEREGWVARERDIDDRRAVVIRARRARRGELFRLYAGMNTSMDNLCSEYDDAELELIADFLRRAADAGRAATDELSDAQSDVS